MRSRVIFNELTLVSAAVAARKVCRASVGCGDARLLRNHTRTLLPSSGVGGGTSRCGRIPTSPDARAKRLWSLAADGSRSSSAHRALSGQWWRAHLPQQGRFSTRASTPRSTAPRCMGLTLWFGVLAFTIVTSTCSMPTTDCLALEEEREDREVQQAIAERVGAAGVMSYSGLRHSRGWAHLSAVIARYWVGSTEANQKRRRGNRGAG